MLTLVPDIKQQALDKMLEEMSKEHSGAEDAIYNWLCDQESDEELTRGILKEDRSINGAFQYCTSKARELAINNCAMVDNDEVFRWAREYFILDKVNVKPVAAKVIATNRKPADKKGKDFHENVSALANARAAGKPKKNKKGLPEGVEQISLFDSL